jgi:hypothetical protein
MIEKIKTDKVMDHRTMKRISGQMFSLWNLAPNKRLAHTMTIPNHTVSLCRYGGTGHVKFAILLEIKNSINLTLSIFCS